MGITELKIGSLTFTHDVLVGWRWVLLDEAGAVACEGTDSDLVRAIDVAYGMALTLGLADGRVARA